MDSSFIGMTDEEVTTWFGRLFDHYIPADLDGDERKEAVAELADLFRTTSITLDIRQNEKKRLAGGNITGTVKDKMCFLLEKMQAYRLRIGDERIWWHSERLRRGAEASLTAELLADIQAREAALERRRRANDASVEKERAEMRWRENELAAQESSLEAAKEDIAERERNMARRETTIADREAAVTGRENRRRIVLEEMQEGGLLGASPGKSLFLAKLELESANHQQRQRWEEKENVFNILTAPVRGVLALLMP